MEILDVDEEVKALMRNLRSNARRVVDSDTRVSDALDIIRLALAQQDKIMREYLVSPAYLKNFIIEKYIKNIVSVIKITLQECLNALMISEMNVFATKTDLIRLVDNFLRDED